MRFYLHAFCLDEKKSKENFDEMLVGPFDSYLGITWDFIRAAGPEDTEGEMDHQFIRHESGFWYPVVEIGVGGWGSMEPDLARGRYTDIYMVPEKDLGGPEAHWAGVPRFPTAVRHLDSKDSGAMQKWLFDKATEEDWLQTPEDSYS
jgi:hypothetical protein